MQVVCIRPGIYSWITKGSLNYQGLNTGQTDLIRRDFTQDKQTYLLVRNRQELLLTVLALNRTLNLQDKFSVLVFCSPGMCVFVFQFYSVSQKPILVVTPQESSTLLLKPSPWPRACRSGSVGPPGSPMASYASAFPALRSQAWATHPSLVHGFYR